MIEQCSLSVPAFLASTDIAGAVELKLLAKILPAHLADARRPA
jgi:hypothetical protein